MLERIAAVLRQKKAVQTLVPDLTVEILKIVSADWIRYDLEDQGKLWSRSIKPGAEPQRPGLGEVPRIKSTETEYSKDIEGGFADTREKLLTYMRTGLLRPSENSPLPKLTDGDEKPK